MRIVVTGAAGFMGSWIAEALHKSGHDVVAVDSCQGGRNQVPGVPLLVGDLSDGHFARHVVDVAPPDVLVHLAADPHEGASWFRVDSVTRNNSGAYASILDACLLTNRLRKVVCFSSMSVYGDQEPPFTENMVLRPVDPYGEAKRAVEGLTWHACGSHRLAGVVIRPHNVFGARQFCADIVRNAVGIFMNRALRREPLLIFGDGEQTRAFSYIEDSLPCYLRAIETDAADGEAVNIGGEVPITLNKMAAVVVEEFPAATIQYIPSRYGEVKHAWSKHDKARELLGFEERIGWREGVHRMAEWAKAHGPWEWEPILVHAPNDRTPKHWAKRIWE